MKASTEQELLDEIKEFPCSFNLENCTDIAINKLKAVRHNLVAELKNEGKYEFDFIRKKNMLSWIYFKLGEQNDSVELNNEIVELTQWRNIATLGNRYIIMWYTGDEEEAKKCLDCLKNMEKKKNFRRHINEARGEQAYYYSKLGGFDNLSRAIDLYSNLVAEVPDNYLWKYCLGLVYRRATHPNIFFSSPKRWNVDEYTKRAIEYLFEVADSCESPLKSMAYAQLINLRQVYRVGQFPEYDRLFRNLNIHHLVKKALEQGGISVPSVLISCGKAMSWRNVDESIDLLEKAVEIKNSSMSYHYLGKSYRRKAQLEVSGKLQTRAKSLSLVETAVDEPFYHLAEGNGGKGNFSYPSRTISDPTGRSSYRSREESGVRRQLFNESSFSGQDCFSTNRNWTSETISQSQPSAQGSYKAPQYSSSLSSVSQKQNNFRKSTGRGQRDQVYQQNRQREGNFQGRRDVIRSYSSPSADGTNRSYHKTEYNPNRGSVTGLETSPSEAEINSCLRKPRNEAYLNKDNEYVKKAMVCFKKAVELDMANFPALLDMGILLKETGEIQEALKQFNKLTNSYHLTKDHKISVISAYEQAGRCYRELSKTDELGKGYEDEGKKKLTQAVSLAADLVLTMPELHESSPNLWSSFEALMNNIDGEEFSPNQFKKKVELLELAKKYREIVDVFLKVSTLTGDLLIDNEIIVIAIKSYLSLDQPENALALQNIIAIRPDVHESDWWNEDPIRELRVNVLLHAISGRLSGINENPTILFQHVFKIIFGTCFGAHDEEQSPPSRDFVGDVLIVFDDDGVEVEASGSTAASSHCLKLVATCLFGLAVEENLKGNYEFGSLKEETQLLRMRKYQVVIIVLGNETRTGVFDYVLKLVPHNKDNTEPSDQRILIIDAGLRDGQVPLSLAQYKCFKLQDIGGLGNITQIPENRDNGDQISNADILTHGFHGNMNAIMKLFCFIVGHNWL